MPILIGRFANAPRAVLVGALAVGVCVSLLHRAAYAATAASGENERAAILGTVQALNEAMARRDVGAAMAVFDDGDGILLVGSDVGEVFRGRVAVRGFLGDLMKLPFIFSFETPEPTIVVNGKTAWLFVEGSMVHTPSAGAVRRIPYRFSLCLVRKAGIWRWQLFHGSIPRSE